MKIIRCEDSKGHGPYRADSYWELKARFPWINSHNNAKHPSPDHDTIDVPKKELESIPVWEHHSRWQCGFTSLKMMHAWFTPQQRRDCVNAGFRFYWLEADDVHIGTYQCVFHRDTAKRLEEIQI